MKRHRATAARKRDRNEVASVALVGYTNAGKSTLLNALADADVYAADMLFATLDPTSRQVALPTGQQVVVTDTVGFINKLPHDLVDAFRATLEEVMRADLLLEVVDAADPDFVGQQAAVQTVLDELGAGDKPRITVFNKIDLLAADAEAAPATDRAVFVSAVTGEGLDTLRERIADALRGQMVAVDAVVPYERGELVARARSSGDVEERYEERGVRVSGHLPAVDRRRADGRRTRRAAGAAPHRAERGGATPPELRAELLAMTARELAAADAFFARCRRRTRARRRARAAPGRAGHAAHHRARRLGGRPARGDDAAGGQRGQRRTLRRPSSTSSTPGRACAWSAPMAPMRPGCSPSTPIARTSCAAAGCRSCERRSRAATPTRATSRR